MGEYLFKEGDATEAETSFHQVESCYWLAIDVVRRQHARSWEPRATASLCTLRQQQGKEEQARQVQARIYGWFTEEFDTRNLHEAKALMEQLANRPGDQH